MGALKSNAILSVDIEERAVLETIRNLCEATDKTRTAIVDHIKDWLEREYKNVGMVFGLSQDDCEGIYLRTGIGDRSLRAAVDRVCAGRGLSEVNFQILSQYIKAHDALFEIYSGIYDRIELEENCGDAFNLGALFGGTAEGVPEYAQALRGDYVFYRPYYYDPTNQIMRCHLKIGGPDGPFSTKLYCVYDASDFGRGQFDYSLDGTTVPLPNLRRAVINLHDESKEKFPTGNQMLYVENVEVFERRASILSGIAISALGSSAGTAWPFIAVKADYRDEFTPDLVSLDDASIKPFVRAKMTRGTVNWDPSFS